MAISPYYNGIYIDVTMLADNLYLVKVKEQEKGTPDITDFMRQIIPGAIPSSGLGFKDGFYQQSFYYYPKVRLH